MATRNGAAGPSNLKSSENLIAVWAVAGPPNRTAAAAVAMMSPVVRPRTFLILFMSHPLGVIRSRVSGSHGGGAGLHVPAQQRACRMKEQGETGAKARPAYFLHIRMPVCRCGRQCGRRRR